MAIFSKTKDDVVLPSSGRVSRGSKMTREERLARKALASHDQQREVLIEELRRSVWSGDYSLNAEKIADALLEERSRERLLEE